jgi:Tol biopolymer transport system component
MEMPSHYELMERLGGRGIGVARRVRDEHPGRFVAGRAAVVLLAMAGIPVACDSRPRPPDSTKAVQLTSLGGSISAPALSPDGRKVAFAWDGEGRDNVDIYVQPLGPGIPVRLTTDLAVDTSPAFSPDGGQIAFKRIPSFGRPLLVVMPATGGPERIVAEGDVFGPGLTWTPDGQALVVSGSVSRDVPLSLSRVSVGSGEAKPLTRPPAFYRQGDTDPTLSADGRTLAFARRVSWTSSEIWLLALSKDFDPSGDPMQLTTEGRGASEPAFTADGSRVVFSVGTAFGGIGPGLMVIAASARGEKARRLPGGDGGAQPVSSKNGDLAFVRTTRDENVWRLPLEEGRPGRPEVLIASARRDCEPRFSADGKRLGFASNRSGSTEVWLCDADGSRPVRLTLTEAASTSGTRWSPDGSRIAFISNASGNMDLYLTTPDGKEPRQLTQSPSHDTAPAWSRDGTWLYFASNREEGFQVWKMRPEPAAPPVRVTRHGGYSALESVDGKTLYYVRTGAGDSIWKVPTDGGEETLVLPRVENWGAFDVTATSIYYVTGEAKRHQLRRLRLADGRDDLLVALDRLYTFGVGAAPDDSAVLYAQLDLSSTELMLIERLR